jgi:hypothetical protein
LLQLAFHGKNNNDLAVRDDGISFAECAWHSLASDVFANAGLIYIATSFFRAIVVTMMFGITSSKE